MEKIRVYELAKQLNVSTKDLMNKLKENTLHTHILKLYNIHKSTTPNQPV